MSIIGGFVLTVLCSTDKFRPFFPADGTSWTIETTAGELKAQTLEATKVLFLVGLAEEFGVEHLTEELGEWSTTPSFFDRHFRLIWTEYSGSLLAEADSLLREPHIRLSGEERRMISRIRPQD
ncbi:MAG: hypothetical protein KC731_12995 [Myxococcales bacterium]|nr:hypothetical protein [Myxococcales bacterium]